MSRILNKKMIIVYVLLILSFMFGAAIDSLFGPMIKINYLSEIKTIEGKITKNNSIEDNSTYVLESLNSSYIKANDFDYMVDAFYNELTYIEVEFESVDYEKYAESEALKGFLKDLRNNNLILKFDMLSGYIVTPNLNYLLENYGEMVELDLKDYITFRAYELNNHIFNENIQTIDIAEIVHRIDILNEEMLKNNEFYDTYDQLQNYYYMVFTGETHDFFFDYDKNELTDYAKKQYENCSSRTDKVGKKAREIIENGPLQKQQIEIKDSEDEYSEVIDQNIKINK